MKIALLESHPAMVEILTTLLQLHGAHVDVYSTGLDLLGALSHPARERTSAAPDLVILDDTVAGSLTACEVVAHLRQSRDVPILVLSGSFEQEDQLKRLFPDLPVIRQPFPIKQVLAHVEYWEQQQKR
jgi:DNA-binding response OmpR family regulator